MSGEAASRSDLGLPGRQRDPAEAVFALGKPVIAVLFSGRPLIVPWLVEEPTRCSLRGFSAPKPAMRHRRHPHRQGLAQRATPVSWPRNLGQVPIFYAERPTGRWADPKDHYTSKYLDIPNTPLFPFGHGLTYGRFAAAPTSAGPVATCRAITSPGAAQEESHVRTIPTARRCLQRNMAEAEERSGRTPRRLARRRTPALMKPLRAFCLAVGRFGSSDQPGHGTDRTGGCGLSADADRSRSAALSAKRAYGDAGCVACSATLPAGDDHAAGDGEKMLAMRRRCAGR